MTLKRYLNCPFEIFNGWDGKKSIFTVDLDLDAFLILEKLEKEINSYKSKMLTDILLYVTEFPIHRFYKENKNKNKKVKVSFLFLNELKTPLIASALHYNISVSKLLSNIFNNIIINDYLWNPYDN